MDIGLGVLIFVGGLVLLSAGAWGWNKLNKWKNRGNTTKNTA